MRKEPKTSQRFRKYIFNEQGAASPHSDEFRRMVSQQVISGRCTIKQATINYEISRGTVYSFIRWYKKNSEIEPIYIRPMTPEEQQEFAKMQLKVREMEVALKEADIKIFSLETLITVAEKELKIAIRKKSGTKQSQ